jgi:hypothetical protein
MVVAVIVDLIAVQEFGYGSDRHGAPPLLSTFSIRKDKCRAVVFGAGKNDRG